MFAFTTIAASTGTPGIGHGVGGVQGLGAVGPRPDARLGKPSAQPMPGHGRPAMPERCATVDLLFNRLWHNGLDGRHTD